jgi:hypothetical protein
MMSYQNKNIQQTNSGNNSVSEAQTSRNGISFPAVSTLQMQGAEEELQMKNKVPVQLMNEEEAIQGKFNVKQNSAVQLKDMSSDNEPINPVQRQEISEKSNKTGMPDNLKSGVENLSGYSMDDVKVHYNSSKPAQLQAYAYAQGTDIHIAPGQEKHLPHEAWHVAQQKQGRVQPTLQMKTGVPVNDEAGLENEADVMGQNALSLRITTLNSTNDHTIQAKKSASTQLVAQLERTQLDLVNQHPVNKPTAKDEIIKAGGDQAVANPFNHPMYPTFQARIASLFTIYAPPPTFDKVTGPEKIWEDICNGIIASKVKMEKKVGNPAYAQKDKDGNQIVKDEDLKQVDMASDNFLDSMGQFNTVMDTLMSINQTQFAKADSFGFYSKPEGREFAEKKSDLTLDTSGIGALFDGMPSLDAHANGWDVQLWGSLSRAYAQAVANQIVVNATTGKTKEVLICAGGQTDKSNVFGMVESKAIEKGVAGIGKSLEEVCTFYAVASISKGTRKVNYGVVSPNGVHGAWYVGQDWKESNRIADEEFNKLPATPPLP